MVKTLCTLKNYQCQLGHGVEHGSSLGPSQNVKPEPSKKGRAPGRARADHMLGPITI